MKNLAIVSRDWEVYEDRFKQEEFLKSHFTLVSSASVLEQKSLDVVEIIIGEPDLVALYVQKCPKLKWVQSSWAGNNKLQAVKKYDYELTGVKDIFGTQMSEYLLSYLLYFTRRLEEFTQLKHKKLWSQLPCKTLSEYEVGIMGTGSIGKHLAQTLLSFGMRVNGYSTSIKGLLNIHEYTNETLDEFLARSDFVFNILPETPATIGLCDETFFAKMKQSSVFINAGRGSVIDSPQSLIDALASAHLKAAVLDVFEQEPLPSNHPYYHTENVHLSCHTAAVSNPQKVFDIFKMNAKRFIAEEPMLYVHSFESAY